MERSGRWYSMRCRQTAAERPKQLEPVRTRFGRLFGAASGVAMLKGDRCGPRVDQLLLNVRTGGTRADLERSLLW